MAVKLVKPESSDPHCKPCYVEILNWEVLLRLFLQMRVKFTFLSCIGDHWAKKNLKAVRMVERTGDFYLREDDD